MTATLLLLRRPLRLVVHFGNELSEELVKCLAGCAGGLVDGDGDGHAGGDEQVDGSSTVLIGARDRKPGGSFGVDDPEDQVSQNFSFKMAVLDSDLVRAVGQKLHGDRSSRSSVEGQSVGLR